MSDQTLARELALIETTVACVNTGALRVIRHQALRRRSSLASILWVPQPSGPIDLHWDGAVYYLLGTSVAHGLGYTIPSEAGSPEAVQYPPLLPAFIALHQLALRTTDFAGCGSVAAKIMRGRLFRIRSRDICHFSEVSPSSICVGCHSDMFAHSETIFFSDLLDAELPFILLSMLFVLVAGNSSLPERS